MKSRYAVLFLSLVLALALAVPALGGPTNPIASISASVKSTANKALKKAKKAQTTANSALSTANSAQSEAKSAQTTANSANTAAKNAQNTANGASTAAKNAQTTADAAKTAAAAAKAAADAAQATANSKFGSTFSEFGETDGPNTTSGLSLVLCPTGSQVTGGGYETSGTGSNEVVATFNSSYGDAWLAALSRIPGQADTWSVRAVVVCAAP
jgi:membrane protein involved in colicin uptake